jgi:hypothetical protein
MQLGEDRLSGGPDLIGRQQAAEEQVSVGGQPSAQRVGVID